MRICGDCREFDIKAVAVSKERVLVIPQIAEDRASEPMPVDFYLTKDAHLFGEIAPENEAKL